MLTSTVFCFLIGFSGWAQEKVPIAGTLYDVRSESEIHTLIEKARFQLELPEDSESGFFRNWIQKFNFKQVGLNAYRWASAQSRDPKMRGDVLNLAMILPTSHLIEMTSGPLGVYFANEMDMGVLVTSAVGAVGGVISVPGLDPLCAILLLTYKFKPVQNTWTLIRVGLFKTSVLVSRWTGMQALWKSVIQTVNRIEALSKEFSGISQVETEKEIMEDGRRVRFRFFSQTGSLTLSLREIQGVTPYVESATVSGDFEMKKWLKPFGFNIRSAIQQILESDGLENLSHIENVDAVESSSREESVDSAAKGEAVAFLTNRDSIASTTKVEFVPYALPLLPKISLRCLGAMKP